MTWLADKLRERIQILQPTQTENANGGFDQEYDTLLTIWAGLKTESFVGRGLENIRGEQINANVTHNFIVRRSAVNSLGKTFSTAFDTNYDNIADLGLIKSEFYILLQRGSTVKGRLFRIRSANDHNERREYITIGAEELEEHGTGYPA